MQNNITQAVVLSAGLGTRLRELFPNIPKVMVPLLGRPLLEWHVDQLRKHGIREIFVNLHYLPDVIKNYFGDGSKWGVEIVYVLEDPEIRGTAGGVKNFDGMLHGDFFVIYGDVFSLVDYSKMAEVFYEKPGAIAMTIVGMNDHPHDSDLVQVDENLKFVKIYPKPNPELPPNWRAMRTTFIMNNRILKYVPPKVYYEIDRELLPEVLAKDEAIYGYETTDFLKDIGTPERYAQVEEYLKKALPKMS